MTTRETLKEHIGNIAFQSLLNCLEKKHGGYSRNDAKELERSAKEIATTVIRHNQSERQQAVEDFADKLKKDFDTSKYDSCVPFDDDDYAEFFLRSTVEKTIKRAIDQVKEEYKEDQE